MRGKRKRLGGALPHFSKLIGQFFQQKPELLRVIGGCSGLSLAFDEID